MRLAKPVLDRIRENMPDVDMTDHDAHWIWPGKLPSPRPKRRVRIGKITVTESHQAPPRIRDNDGKRKSVSRILHRELRGFDYPYNLPRSHGCDYTCVNPWHLPHPPSEFDDIEVRPADEEEDIQGLVDELRDFIAAYGLDEAAIRDRYGLDYTDDEITIAIRKIENANL